MANLNLSATASTQSMSVDSGAQITVQVTPVAPQNITINRGLSGPPGPNAIGGYGFNIQSLQAQDVLMFGGAAWENTPQVEITDGGNF
jgi:hypothetical protein